MITTDTDFTRESLLDDEFSLDTALSLARASELAYLEDELMLRAAIAEWGMEPASVFSQDDSEGFIAQDEQLLILAFRGTVSVTDWLRNLKITRREVPKGKVHSGFMEGLDAVWDEKIEPVLRSAAGVGRKIWITGHSLGGALATLAASRADEWLDISGVYTFGQPAVGNRRFAKLFNRVFTDRFHRFINDRDIVTKIPPAPLYAHVGERVRFDGDGTLIDSYQQRGDDAGPETLSEDEFALMQQMLEASQPDEDAYERALLPDLPFLSGIDDHNLVGGYIPKLRKLAG